MGKRVEKRRDKSNSSHLCSSSKTSQGGDQIKNADDYKQAKQVEGNNTNKSSPIQLVELSGSHDVGNHQESTVTTFTPAAAATVERNPPPPSPPPPASLVGGIVEKRGQIKLFSSVPPQKTSQGGDQIKNADDCKQAKQVEGNNTNKSSTIELVELSGSHDVGDHQESSPLSHLLLQQRLNGILLYHRHHHLHRLLEECDQIKNADDYKQAKQVEGNNTNKSSPIELVELSGSHDIGGHQESTVTTFRLAAAATVERNPPPPSPPPPASLVGGIVEKRRQIKLFSSVPPHKTSQGGDQIKNADDYKQAKQVEGNNTNKSSPIELVELSGSHDVGDHQESTVTTFTPAAAATVERNPPPPSPPPPASLVGGMYNADDYKQAKQVEGNNTNKSAPIELVELSGSHDVGDHQESTVATFTPAAAATVERNPPPPSPPPPASLVGEPGSSTGDAPGGTPPPLPAVLVDENKQKQANVWSAVIGACGFFAIIFCFFACAAFAYFTSSVLTKETQKMCATIIALAFLGIAACMIVCLLAIKSIMYLSGLKSRKAWKDARLDHHHGGGWRKKLHYYSSI
ncbi:hypothetical protein Sjap_020355 [Stephania japonica]|uniref:Uncharacterized protein n=1 Tax=Stephania japonica TaxID=461633 RepID=A0AAP0F0J0_9MAGN